MKKLALQLTVSLLFFLGLWLGLSMLPWGKWLKIEAFNKRRQKDISELFLKIHRLEKQEINNDSSTLIINNIKDKLCLSNAIDTASIHIHIFRDDVENAYAIPGGHIIVNNSLIADCDNADMLAGVIAHEIGHIQNGHIGKKMTKEVLLSVLMMFGGDNMGIVKEILRSLSSGKFDRMQETDADNSAVIYLQKANVNPKHLASFFRKLSAKSGNLSGMLEWVSTHPNPGDRAKQIDRAIKHKTYTEIISAKDWNTLLANND